MDCAIILSACVYKGSSGSVTFRNVPPRGERNTPYSLRVLAKNTDGLRTVIRTSVRPGEKNGKLGTIHRIYHSTFKGMGGGEVAVSESK